MRFAILKTRFIGYLILLAITSWFLFNFLVTRQSSVMYKYFIEKPATYNVERAERIASSIYQSFNTEVKFPSLTNIKNFVEKYNGIPFLSVNFIYHDDTGAIKSVISDVNDINILSAEYVYPIKRDNRDLGTLLVYDINKEYKKGMAEYHEIMNLTRIFFAILLVLLFSIVLFREYSTKIEKEKREAEYQAVHDGLTGLYTQKYFKEHLSREISRSRRYKRPVSLIMCDIDRFKQFNDTHGHLAGDKAIQTVARIISENVRTSDIVARYGGEEFAVLLIEAGFEQAQNVARRLKDLTDKAIDTAGRIKDEVEQTTILVKKKELNVTISMGIASYNGEPDYKPDYLISGADQALYASKENGRNQITLLDPDTKEFVKM